MKNFLLLLLLLPVILSAQTKYALIVANADYEKYNGGWVSLSSARDTELVIDALTKQGFERANIFVANDITEKEFTPAFKKYLIDKVKPGDVAYFHYSGHGQQVSDDNSDEDDGYDEALVGIDAPMSEKYDSLYAGAKHIRDDELGACLDSLREKLGPTGNVLATIDACHSGSVSRGGGAHSFPHTRGTDLKWNLDNAQKKIDTKNSDDGFVSTKNYNSYADLMVISASSQNQYDSEHPSENCGSLTYAFNAAFTKAQRGSSYLSLFQNIKQLMAEFPVSNIPQYDGNADKEILGNNIKGSTVYFKVKNIYKGKFALVDAGEVNGLFIGTEVSLYYSSVDNPKDTSSSNLLARGVVDSSSLLQCILKVTLSGKTKIEQLKGANVFVTKSSFAGLVTKIKVEDVALRALIDSAIARNADSNLIEVNESSYHLLVQSIPKVQQVNLVDRTNKIIAASVTLDSMFYRIIEFGRVNLMQNLSTKKIEDVSFKIVKAEKCKAGTNGKDVCNYSSLVDSIDVAGHYHLGMEDAIAFSIVDNLPRYDNNASYFHYMLFEITPTKQLNVVFPQIDANGNFDFTSCQLKHRDTLSYNLLTWYMSPPAGTYQLRLFLSQKPFDENSVRDLYTYAGIRKEADKYSVSRGKKEKLKDAKEGNLELQEEVSGVYDLFYEVQ